MFLTAVKNKSCLIEFWVGEWRKEAHRVKLQQKVLFATVNDKCYRITSEESREIQELQCQQEEADGRLLLHAVHAVRHGYKAIVICSEDTDVFVMSLAFNDKIGVPLFQKYRTRTRTRLVNTTKVTNAIGSNVCKALIGMHAFTGCDTVSAFAGKGKTSALKLVSNSKQTEITFAEVGQRWDLSNDLKDRLEAFTCLLYAPKASSTKVNSMRYIFYAKKGEIESHQLPPCQDCFLQHARRANYQAAIWRRCLDQDPKVPSPVGHGWLKNKEHGVEQLVVKWMEGQPAPEAVLNLLACNCTTKCSLQRCVCVSNGLKCTDMCKLQGCDNQCLESDNVTTFENAIEDIEDKFEF